MGRLPPQYTGWESHGRAARRMSTPELVGVIQDGPPAQRMAALSVIDLRDVEPGTVEDWIRNLPDAEANQLAGAIPARDRPGSCRDCYRWVRLSRLGYERRRLATFLVTLFETLETMEGHDCGLTALAWEETAEWLGRVYGDAANGEDIEACDDLSLFVFENYLDRHAVFEAFCALVSVHRELALRVTADPVRYVSGLPHANQAALFEEAERAGGLSAADAWARLRRGVAP